MPEGGAGASPPSGPPRPGARSGVSAGMPDPAWADALIAARLFATAPAMLGGIHVVARASPVRARWLDHVRALLPVSVPLRRITPAVPAGRLTGGIDIAATLARGRPVRQAGLLETVAGGALVLAMAERLAPDLAGIVARALDGDGEGRFGVIALDEGEDDEDHAVPGAIADRLGLRIRLDGISIRDARTKDGRRTAPAPETIAAVRVPDALAETVVAAAAMTRGASMRPPAQALRATRLLAALDGRAQADERDVATALRLTCGAMVEAPPEDAGANETKGAGDDLPSGQDGKADAADGENTRSEGRSIDPDMLRDMLIAAGKGVRLDLAAFRETATSRARAPAAAGKAGAVRKGARRGRPAGQVARPPRPGARPDVVATLRTAAPWQPVRRKARGLPPRSRGEPLDVRPDDLRYARYAHNAESMAIFAVDASGSTALERLGEAKGCVELLLAECYVRRDQVALIAFRGQDAEVLLEPTRSLARAKRSLTALPGGGPTPLAAGLGRAVDMAGRAGRRGQSPLIVMLTDGKGNVALDGTQDRAMARRDAEEMARRAVLTGARAVIIDIARRPRDAARALAGTMGADYVALPRADAHAMSELVSGYLKGP